MMAAVMMGASVERATAQPKGILVPHGLLVNHDGLGLRFHEHTPQGEREGNDRYD
jgi:hypothetical protein